jgi:F1F0 ATPase subunit 2
MNEALPLVLAWLAGAVLGAIFFGGLWWTVREGMSSKRPALWFLGSLLVRMTIVLAGFYFIAGGHWQRFLVSGMGFALARLAVTWLTSPAETTQDRTGGKSCA